MPNNIQGTQNLDQIGTSRAAPNINIAINMIVAAMNILNQMFDNYMYQAEMNQHLYIFHLLLIMTINKTSVDEKKVSPVYASLTL